MPEKSINFFSQGISYKLLKKNRVKNWIGDVIKSEKKRLGSLNIIFCSDKYLLNLNIKYLNHNYLTDVITFDYTDEDIVSGDVFMSLDRIKDNAILLSVNEKDEVHRVLIHGVLHLLGYSDKTPAQQKIMRKREDYCLSLRTF